jgi:hypothetical protein
MDTGHWEFLIIGILIVSFGVFNVWSAYKKHQKIVASKNWPVSLGDVIAARINKTWVRNGISYHPEIAYHYFVTGVEYTNNIRLKSTMRGQIGNDILEMFPIGSHIRISYNPKNPKDCISEEDEESFPWLGLGAIVIGVWLIIVVFIPGAITSGPGRH